MGGGWGCPHEIDDLCSKVNNLPCDPGMKGCVLYGRFVFYNDDKNERNVRKKHSAIAWQKTRILISVEAERLSPHQKYEV